MTDCRLFGDCRLSICGIWIARLTNSTVTQSSMAFTQSSIANRQTVGNQSIVD